MDEMGEEVGMIKVIKKLLDDARDRKHQRQRMIVKPYRGVLEEHLKGEMNIDSMDIKNFQCSSSPPLVGNM
jgi:hypothetical protein